MIRSLESKFCHYKIEYVSIKKKQTGKYCSVLNDYRNLLCDHSSHCQAHDCKFVDSHHGIVDYTQM